MERLTRIRLREIERQVVERARRLYFLRRLRREDDLPVLERVRRAAEHCAALYADQFGEYLDADDPDIVDWIADRTELGFDNRPWRRSGGV